MMMLWAIETAGRAVVMALALAIAAGQGVAAPPGVSTAEVVREARAEGEAVMHPAAGEAD